MKEEGQALPQEAREVRSNAHDLKDNSSIQSLLCDSLDCKSFISKHIWRQASRIKDTQELKVRVRDSRQDQVDEHKQRV